MENQERDLQRDCPSDGDAVERAYQQGIEAGKLRSLELAQFTTYAERIAFRAGWIKGKKE